MPSVRIPSALRSFTGGHADVETTAATVRDAIADLDRRHPGLANKVLDGAGAVKPFIRIFVGADDIGSLSGLDTALTDRDEMSIVPAIAGGSAELTPADRSSVGAGGSAELTPADRSSVGARGSALGHPGA